MNTKERMRRASQSRAKMSKIKKVQLLSRDAFAVGVSALGVVGDVIKTKLEKDATAAVADAAGKAVSETARAVTAPVAESIRGGNETVMTAVKEIYASNDDMDRLGGKHKLAAEHEKRQSENNKSLTKMGLGFICGSVVLCFFMKKKFDVKQALRELELQKYMFENQGFFARLCR